MYFCTEAFKSAPIGLLPTKDIATSWKWFLTGQKGMAKEGVYSNCFNPSTKEENIFILAVDVICCFCCSKT